MASRLARCLAAVQIVENSVNPVSPEGSIDEMRSALTYAQAVLQDIGQQLDGMGLRFS
ncbi:hypothetical protein [Bradyrhizobium sp. WSM2254]|uniref:hypothetical protein n=1 Tax=Bradyrhizobium sp. WSM2254 TaxID=1188263 RepID=UPI0012EBF415|nr:hypothetical protein [Bradyrhizobium sp. WSM2254]